MKYIFFLIVLFVNMFANATPCNNSGSLLSVKKTISGRTEYIVFTVKAPYQSTPTVTNPGPPFIHDASGQTISIQGCKYKKIVFEQVEWTCSSLLSLNAKSKCILQVKNTGQFEGVIPS